MHGKQMMPGHAGILALSTLGQQASWTTRGRHYSNRRRGRWRMVRAGYRRVVARIGCHMRRGRLAIRSGLATLRWW